jgi:hypothetical protein
LAPRRSSDGGDLFDFLGAAFTLLAFDPKAAAVEAFQPAAHRPGLPLKVVTDTGSDGRGRYRADWFSCVRISSPPGHQITRRPIPRLFCGK